MFNPRRAFVINVNEHFPEQNSFLAMYVSFPDLAIQKFSTSVNLEKHFQSKYHPPTGIFLIFKLFELSTHSGRCSTCLLFCLGIFEV